MFKINIFCILKENQDEFDILFKKYEKMLGKFAKVKSVYIFDKNIQKAQNISAYEAKKAYTKVFLPYLNSSYNIALDVKGASLDTFAFTKIFENEANINFFIAGAYGFEEGFLQKCNKIISLSQLTFAHKIAKLVLFEQIYRCFSIKTNHPYHK